MVNGCAEKILEISLTNKKVEKITFSDKILQDYTEGRGIGVRILWDRLGKNK
jgi:aldehyde:ferredoxin oxidoreductase